MNHQQSQGPDIDVLMQRIRDVLAERSADGRDVLSRLQLPQLVYPSTDVFTVEAVSPLAFQALHWIESKGTYELDELLAFHDEHFIHAAYLAVLGRTADQAGFEHHLDLLRRGTPKVDILGRMRYCEEGRKRGVLVKGLRRAYAFQRVFRLPVVGRTLQVFAALWRLPQFEQNHRAFENYVVRLIGLSEAHQHDRYKALVGPINTAVAAIRELQLVTSQNAAAIAGAIEGIDEILQKKSEKTAVTHLVSAVRAVEAIAVERNEALSGQLGALAARIQDKADQSIVTELNENLTAAAARADLLAEQFASLVPEVAEKASRSELADVANDLIGIQSTLAQTRSELSAWLDDLGHAVSAKAERIEVAELSARLEDVPGIIDHKVEQIAPSVASADFHAALEQSKAAIKSSIDHCRAASGCVAGPREQQWMQIESQVRNLKLNLLDQERRLKLLLEEARKRLPEPISQAQIESMVSEEDHMLDAFYVAFEDQFRGTREDIKNRVSVYLTTVREAGAGTPEAPILDLGCGRGEWLELLKEQGLLARGLDLNRVMVAQCVETGLSVQEAEAIAYLRSLPAKSLGAVTGFHIIEHIPFRRLIDLFDEALRVLKPGGVIIFETPNPENLVVGACNFYYDPTHLNPLPPSTVRFVSEVRGFVRPEVKFLHPVPGEELGHFDLPTPIYNRFFGCQDYAIIAYKA